MRHLVIKFRQNERRLRGWGKGEGVLNRHSASVRENEELMMEVTVAPYGNVLNATALFT